MFDAVDLPWGRGISLVGVLLDRLDGVLEVLEDNRLALPANLRGGIRAHDESRVSVSVLKQLVALLGVLSLPLGDQELVVAQRLGVALEADVSVKAKLVTLALSLELAFSVLGNVVE